MSSGSFSNFCITLLGNSAGANVRLEFRTSCHVFMVILSYKIVQEHAERWRAIDLTVEEEVTKNVMSASPFCIKNS